MDQGGLQGVGKGKPGLIEFTVSWATCWPHVVLYSKKPKSVQGILICKHST